MVAGILASGCPASPFHQLETSSLPLVVTLMQLFEVIPKTTTTHPTEQAACPYVTRLIQMIMGLAQGLDVAKLPISPGDFEKSRLEWIAMTITQKYGTSTRVAMPLWWKTLGSIFPIQVSNNSITQKKFQ